MTGRDQDPAGVDGLGCGWMAIGTPVASVPGAGTDALTYVGFESSRFGAGGVLCWATWMAAWSRSGGQGVVPAT